MNGTRIWIICLAISCAACTVPVGEVPAPDESDPYKTIYLVSHGWHAGIVLRRADIPDGAWPVRGDFADARYLEVGWGDRDFYQTPNPHIGLILKAALLPSDSVLHVVGFSAAVPDFFRFSEIIRIELPAARFDQLSRTIAASFVTQADGNATPLGSGLYGESRFYLSGERYHLFNTCNVWTARVLRSAGFPIAAAVRVEGLMSQARRFGVVVQSRPEPAE